MNRQRVLKRISSLAEIGREPNGGGITREGYTEEERRAKARVQEWMEEAGLHVRMDEAGNLFGTFDGACSEQPRVLTGSHVDTVPNGGMFDGAAGVVAALEVAQDWAERGVRPERNLDVVVFADEEGTRFRGGMTGSRALAGSLAVDELQKRTDENGLSFPEALQQNGLDFQRIRQAERHSDSIAAFIELHIEQGRVLEEQKASVGIVSGIAGAVWLEGTFRGNTDHAGATPMVLRKDVAAALAQLILAAERFPVDISPTAVATVGKMEVFPGNVNTIPGYAEWMVDIRDIDEKKRDRLVHRIKAEAERIGALRGLSTEVREVFRTTPVSVDPSIKETMIQSAQALGKDYRVMPSGAAHDAMIMGERFPVGMIFVPSRDGVSHHPDEHTDTDDLMDGIRVLERTLYSLCHA